MIIANDILKDKGSEIYFVTPDFTIYQTIEKMIGWKVGSVLIKEDEKFIGLWTERDFIRNIYQSDIDIKTDKIKDYMLRRLHVASSENNVYELMDKFLGLRVRHLLIENNGVYVGVLSVGDVMKSMINEKTKELKDINEIINWEYYENWQW